MFSRQICELELKICSYYVDVLFGIVSSAQNDRIGLVLRMHALL